MKKLLTLFCAIILCLTVLFTGCANNAVDVSNAVKLPHFDGLNQDGSFDSDVFYRNDLTVFGGDSGIIYVPENRYPANNPKHIYNGTFYQYMSGNGGVQTPAKDSWGDNGGYAFACLSSKDLNDWKLAGAVSDGYSLHLNKECWTAGYYWAPEVGYDAVTDQYFMYFSAYRNTGKGSASDNFMLGFAVSETPVGPFELVNSTDFYQGKTLKEGQKTEGGLISNLNGDYLTEEDTPWLLYKHFNLSYNWGAIDPTFFVDDDGQMYLFFAREYSSQSKYEFPIIPEGVNDGNVGTSHMEIWGLKMKDPISPDYDTLTMLTFPNYSKVEYVSGPRYLESSYKVSGYYTTDDHVDYEGNLNEAPQMTTHVGSDGVKRYYLTYSQNGFAAFDYGCHQAVSTSPLGSYLKEGRYKGALTCEKDNDYLTGTGHHVMINVGDELYCCYWVHGDPKDTSSSSNNGRVYAFDRVSFAYDKSAGYDLMFGNGPTKSLQFLPNVVTGYKNVALNAKITVNGGKGTNYLNDGLVPCLSYYKDWEFKSDGKAQITLTFNKPVTVKAISIANSFDYNYAFSSIDYVAFELSEKPSWYKGTYTGTLIIQDLGFNSDYVNFEKQLMRHGGASVASFNEIKVNKITVKVSKKIDDGNNQIRIGEISVLGK